MLNQQSTIFISGASDGLGKAIALEIAQRTTCKLAICGRNENKLRQTLKEIAALQPDMEVTAAAFDLNDEEACHQFAQDILQRYGRVDILVNNAGANLKKDKVEDLNIQHLKEMFQINCVAPVIFIQEFLPKMKEKHDGHVINILSSVCLHSIETTAGYSASKHAMNIIHKILLKEVREENIKVSGIYPGGIDTNFRTNKRPDYLDPQKLAKVIVDVMEIEDGVVHDLVMRPMVENNF